MNIDEVIEYLKANNQDIKPLFTHSITKGSGEKIEWLCPCGKKFLRSPRDTLRNCGIGKKTCGKCNLLDIEQINQILLALGSSLSPLFTHSISRGSSKKDNWLCKCGRETSIVINNVTSGHAISCGQCNLITAEEMKMWKQYGLRIKYPKNIMPGSSNKEWWLCDCGRETYTVIYGVMSGQIKSCGKCNLKTAEEMKTWKLYKLRMKYPRDILPGFNGKEWWLCDCGKETFAVVSSVMAGGTKSCGRCNLITAEEMKTKKIGKLRMKIPQDIKPGSHKKVEWICDCGNETMVAPHSVILGHTRSCGRCSDIVKDWYLTNIEIIKALKCPIKPEDFPVGGPIPLEIILKSHDHFKAQCAACGDVYYPRLHDIKQNKGGLTCGCSYNKISYAQKEITEFIKLFNLAVTNEYEVNGLKYDIFIPSHNLLIEYNGLNWHSKQYSKQRDIKKYQNAILNGFNCLSIFEDEWRFSKLKVESLLKNKFGLIKSQTIRPLKCEIKIIPSQEADLFYEQFHYIGKCHPKLSYGVFYNLQLIACISFSRPTRQTSKHPWELVRMASDPEFKVYGIWSKLLKKFIREQSPTSIVSFSDNRLFSGKVYEKMGFRFDAEIQPDYYWVKRNKRFHKSGLRKTKEERLTSLTETQLREAQGYKKIWDLGKKRWVLSFKSLYLE
jgi:hypothetical protein